MVPLLARHGVHAVHLGINAACIPPAVPPVFRWRDEASNTEILMLVYAGRSFLLTLLVSSVLLAQRSLETAGAMAAT